MSTQRPVPTCWHLALLASMLVGAMQGPCLAALPFTCKADGDTWMVEGSPDHRMACALRCILRDGTGEQDTVSCSPLVSPGPHPHPVCEGFLLGRKWKSASLVAMDCSTADP